MACSNMHPLHTLRASPHVYGMVGHALGQPTPARFYSPLAGATVDELRLCPNQVCLPVHGVHAHGVRPLTRVECTLSCPNQTRAARVASDLETGEVVLRATHTH